MKENKFSENEADKIIKESKRKAKERREIIDQLREFVEKTNILYDDIVSMIISDQMSEIGKRGGQSTSLAKKKASSNNGKRGGRPSVKKND